MEPEMGEMAKKAYKLMRVDTVPSLLPHLCQAYYHS